jgi:hypothetical protein
MNIGIKTAVRLVLLAYLVSISVLIYTGWFFPLFDIRLWNMFSLIGTPTLAIITLAAVVYGLVEHRSLWWIIPCEVISLVAFTLIGITLLVAVFSVGG